MKILAFTDIHGSLDALKVVKKKAKNVDLILCMGDITIFEQNMAFILKKINSLGKKVLLIPGNHEDDEFLKHYLKRFKNIKYINNKYHADDEVLILAIEGNGFVLKDKEFEKTAKKLEKALKMKKHKDKKYLLMTHAPPYGTKHDLLYGGEHCGNKSVRDFIKKTKPLYAFCGHIHEGNNTKDKIGKTLTMNPGPKGRVINI